MSSLLVPVIGVLIAVIGIAAAVTAWKYRKDGKRHKPDYYAFFVMGLIWTVAGAASMFFSNFSLSGLFAMGVIFLIAGIANRGKWKENRKKWSDIYRRQNFIVLVLVAAGVILLVIGIAALMLPE